jgi:hypothetical protein
MMKEGMNGEMVAFYGSSRGGDLEIGFLSHALFIIPLAPSCFFSEVRGNTKDLFRDPLQTNAIKGTITS